MNSGEIFITALCLSADAFTASVCKGLSIKKATVGQSAAVGLYFGLFQAIMPLLGYLLGIRFKSFTANTAPLIAFALLLLIGINMIRESKTEEKISPSFSPRAMLPVAIATSIDALAVGISLAMLPDTDIKTAVTVIGTVTFLLSAIGLKAGSLLGARLGGRARIVGGGILILLGVKILLEYVGVLH